MVGALRRSPAITVASGAVADRLPTKFPDIAASENVLHTDRIHMTDDLGWYRGKRRSNRGVSFYVFLSFSLSLSQSLSFSLPFSLRSSSSYASRYLRANATRAKYFDIAAVKCFSDIREIGRRRPSSNQNEYCFKE